MELLREAYRTYDVVLNQLSDPRVNGFPIMGSPFYVIILSIAYNYFVQTLGPKLMEKRKAFELKYVMIVYNIVQILSNGYFTFLSIKLIWIPMKYSLLCETVDYSDDPLAARIAFNAYFFFLTKILDLLDTVFMVLRKKNQQITFLHIYHHTGMVIATWIGVKYVAGGHGVFFATVNCFVHTVMYSYYLLTAIYPQYKKSIWWKKHITELQLAQFVVTTIHGFVALANPNCGYPKSLIAIFIPQDVFMFFLFWDFYRKAYWPKNNEDDKKQN